MDSAPQNLIFAVLGLGVVTAIVLVVLLYRLYLNRSEKYNFVTIIAHKFRTPLSAVKWNLENLIPNEQDSFKKQDLQNIQKMNEQLISLTNTLIELADSDKAARLSYNFEKVPLCDISRAVEQSIRTIAQEKNIAFTVECVQNPLVNVDRARLQFVLFTVYHNAVTYTSAGGRVDVRIGVDGRKAVIVTTDSGIGINRGDLPNIFRKFHRADNAKSFDTEGLGVGLYLSTAIMRRLRGKITAGSGGKDTGSTFVVTLPVAKGK